MHQFLEYLRRSSGQKVLSLIVRLKNAFKEKQIIVLPSGVRWIAHQSYLDGNLMTQTFETSELRFIQRYLRPEMTILDVGAHHGLYSLLASQRVGTGGTVIAFEPSPRERKVLKSHLAINHCRNVRVEPFALGSKTEVATFYQVVDSNNCCSSLRPPATSSPTKPIRVSIIPVDDYLTNNHIKAVDFIKIDTEGAELEVLKGAGRTLAVAPRPVLLMEVAEIRTAPWGYPASMILAHVRELAYAWYSIEDDGSLAALQPDHDINDTNLVAIPLERITEVTEILHPNGKTNAHAVHNS
jgi:FkbM family methyltransferase